MLPFLKSKNQGGMASTIIKNRAPDEKPMDQTEDPMDDSAEVEAAADALIKAIHNRDISAVAQALKDAFEIIQSTPESDDNSFEAQNIKAAE